MLCPRDCCQKSLQLGENGVGRRGPDERMRRAVVPRDVGVDPLDQSPDRAERPPRIAWRVMRPNQTSTWLSQEAYIGVKCT